MRHLHFTQSVEPLQGGGLGSSALALHRELLAQGIESTLCATYGERAQSAVPGTREFKRLKPGVLYFSPAMSRQAADLVGAAVVLHGHGLYVGTNYIFGGHARKQLKPLVYHVQGMFEPYILNRSRWKKRLVHWLFEDANIRDVRLWRALTPKEADQIRARGYRAPIVVAPNGIDLGHYNRAGQPDDPIETPLIGALKKTRKRLLFLARIHPKKGLNLLLPAWAGLGAARRGWELVIAGPDEQGYMETVRRLAEELGVEEEITFTGTVTGQHKVNLFHSADLYALTSYSEGMPTSVLEAMACAVPVVATRDCNIAEIGPAAKPGNASRSWQAFGTPWPKHSPRARRNGANGGIMAGAWWGRSIRGPQFQPKFSKPAPSTAPDRMTRVRNDLFEPGRGLERGRSLGVEALWYLIKCLVFLTPLPFSSRIKVIILRCFGAQVGRGVVIKPRVNIHFPWKLSVGDYSWLGEEVFILNFEPVVIGTHCCISQRAFLCAGNHDYKDPAMPYRNQPITVGDGAWVGAQVFVAPGANIGSETVISAGSVVTRDQPPGMVCAGNPCRALKQRWT